MLLFDGEYPAGHPKAKLLRALVKLGKKKNGESTNNNDKQQKCN